MSKDLAAEIAKLEKHLEKLKQEQADQERPKLVDKPNFSRLLAVLDQHLDEVAAGQEDDDTEHFIYEEVLKAFYGKNVFEWMNKHL